MRIFTLYWKEFTQFEDSSGLSREPLVVKHCVKPLIGYTYVYVNIILELGLLYTISISLQIVK